MSDSEAKIRKKEAKAGVKAAKAAAKAGGRPAGAGGAGVSIRKTGDSSELVVSGLSDRQLERMLPGINKEVMIAVTEERSAFRAGLMRFVREGLFQTTVKIVAGLVVGYLLIRFGLR